FIVNAPCAPLSISIRSIWQRIHCGPVVVVAPRGPGETATGLGGPSASFTCSTVFRVAHSKSPPTKQMVELDLDHFDGSVALEGNSVYVVFSWKTFVINPLDEKHLLSYRQHTFEAGMLKHLNLHEPIYYHLRNRMRLLLHDHHPVCLSRPPMFQRPNI